MQSKTALIVENNLKTVVENLGFELYEVEYLKKQNGMNLTLFITKKDSPVTINDCELVHRTVDPILDELDPTNGASYYLNVSSVGLDKPIKSDKDFNRCLGKEISVKLYSNKNKILNTSQTLENKKLQKENKNEIIGILKNFNEKEIFLEVDNLQNNLITILRQDISTCKLNIKIS